jgi:hypothetical protein
MLNTLPAAPAGRQPRGAVRVLGLNGRWQTMTGWTDCEVEQNSFAAADTFRVKFAVNAMPAGFDANWFSQQQDIEVEIYAGFPANPENFAFSDLALLISGGVDNVEIEYSMENTTLTVTGRDKTALMIDTKTTQQYRSKVASDVAMLLANEHGLTTTYITPTTTKIGKYYALHNDGLNMVQSEWDMLSFLARQEGFNCYVKGNDLHFEPVPDGSGTPYVLKWDKNPERGSPVFNGMSLSFSHSLTVAKGVSVTVSSASLLQKKPVTATYPKPGNASVQAGQSKAKTQVYNIEAKAGLTKAQVLQMAQSKYHEIIAHEMKLHAELPGDNLISTTVPILVQGTGTAYDQRYFADSIVRRLSVATGYSMRVSAKNHSPNNPL